MTACSPWTGARGRRISLSKNTCAIVPGTWYTTDPSIDTLATGPREAQRVIRSLMNDAYNSTETEQLDRERDAMARAQGGAEAGEGIRAFLEKRKPDFSK